MARAPEKDDSVFDFLYIDSQRIALFLSQFSQYGHLKALTRSVGESSKTGGGIDLKIVKADYSEGEDSNLKKEYDAQWVAPLTFLDEADKRGMIERDIAKARMGKLLLISGQLAMLEFAMLKDAWGLPFVRQQVSSGVPSTSPKRSGRDRVAPEADFLLDLMKLWPHVTQVLLTGDGASVWGTIRDEGLMTPASDLLLKHGVSIAGDWNLVGILDAMPELGEPASPEAAAQAGMLNPAVPSLVGTLFSTLAPITRQALGRPTTAFGITPLLIFREVSG